MKIILLYSSLVIGIFFTNAIPVGSQTYNWIQTDTSTGLFINTLLPFKNYLIVCPGSQQGLIFKTTNEGKSWEDIGIGGDCTSDIYCIASDSQNTLYAGTLGGATYTVKRNGIYRSIDEGKTWINTHPNITDDAINSIRSIATTSKNTVFAIDYFDKEQKNTILRTYDKGVTWEIVRSGDINSRYQRLSIDRSDNIFMTEWSDNEGGIWYSVDDGTTWKSKNDGLPSLAVDAPVLPLPNGSMYAGLRNDGIYLATELSSNFIQANFGLSTYRIISFLRASNGRLFAGSFDHGVFYSDDGKNWTKINNGLSSYQITSIVELKGIETNNIFCGTWGAGVYRLTSINTVRKNTGFHNVNFYPNPLSAKTTFSFSLPKEEFTSVKIYSPLGNEIATVVNQRLPEGEQHFEFDASHLRSGVYYYRLQIGDIVETKPMVVAH